MTSRWRGYGYEMVTSRGVAAFLALWLLAGCGDDDADQEGRRESTEQGAARQTVVTGVVGATLETRDEYESNGQPVRERLSTAVLRVDDPAVPDNPYLADALTKPKHRWIRVRVRLKQGGGTPTTGLTQQFAARSPSGETFEAAGASVVDRRYRARRMRSNLVPVELEWASSRSRHQQARGSKPLSSGTPASGLFPMFPDGHCPNEHRHDRPPPFDG